MPEPIAAARISTAVDGRARPAVPPLGRALVGEAVGTFLLVLFGTGAVAAAVLTGAQVGLWQVAVVWGFGVSLAIYCSAAASGAHLNPAVSLAFALWRPAGFPRRRVLPYWGAQMAGAVLAGATVAAIVWPFLTRFEAAKASSVALPARSRRRWSSASTSRTRRCSAPARPPARSSRPCTRPWSRASARPCSSSSSSP